MTPDFFQRRCLKCWVIADDTFFTIVENFQAVYKTD
jgi:hypothetical protein